VSSLRRNESLSVDEKLDRCCVVFLIKWEHVRAKSSRLTFMFVQVGAAASAEAPGFRFAIGWRTEARRNRLTLESIPAFTIS